MTTRPERLMPDFCSRRHPFHAATAIVTLMKLDVDLSRIRLLAVGTHQNYRGEVHEQEPDPGATLRPDTTVTLHVGCESPVDMVPFQFFYGVGGRRDRSGDWEGNARSLMAPFDAAVQRYRALTDYHAMRYRLGVIDEDHLRRYFELFAFESTETTASLSDRLLWAALLPSFHHWAGNPDLVEKAVTFFLGYPCRIIENVPARYNIPDHLWFRLGQSNTRLGGETALGRSFVEADSCYKVILSDVAPEDVPLYLEGGRGRRRLEALLDICMPGNLAHQIEIRARRTGLRPGDKQRAAYLGYTSHV
ncbi:hypothetical protein GF420_03440 [candidate division GN15 bacterium]|nr:hypothetical protein [candidate division GN15 bacterium]